MFHSIERDDQQPTEDGGVFEELRPLLLALHRVVDLPETMPGNRGRPHGSGFASTSSPDTMKMAASSGRPAVRASFTNPLY